MLINANNRADVQAIARDLLGKVMVTHFDGFVDYYRIFVEAYAGVTDLGLTSLYGRRTNVPEIMYGAGGTAYVKIRVAAFIIYLMVSDQPGMTFRML